MLANPQQCMPRPSTQLTAVSTICKLATKGFPPMATQGKTKIAKRTVVTAALTAGMLAGGGAAGLTALTATN